MSNARICDIDGTIFAEGAEGSKVLSGESMEYNTALGRVVPIGTQMDVCPKCAGAGGPVQPRLAVSGPEAAHDVQVVPDPAPETLTMARMPMAGRTYPTASERTEYSTVERDGPLF